MGAVLARELAFVLGEEVERCVGVALAWGLALALGEE